MKKIILITIALILSISTKIEATKLYNVEDKIIITTELIDETIFKLDKKHDLKFEKLKNKEKEELLKTMIKASAIYYSKEKELKKTKYEKDGGKEYSFKGYYKFQLDKMKKTNLPSNVMELRKIILFYTLWTTQQIKNLSLETKVSKKEIEEGYKKLKENFDIPETKKYIYVESKEKKEIEKIIKELNKNHANIKKRLIEIIIKEKINNPKVKVIYAYDTKKGIAKREVSKKQKEIWDIKVKQGEYTNKPIKIRNKYILFYLKEKQEAKKITLKEVADKIKESIKRYKIIVKMNQKIKEAIDKTKIRTLYKTEEIFN